MFHLSLTLAALASACACDSSVNLLTERCQRVFIFSSAEDEINVPIALGAFRDKNFLHLII